MRQFLIFKDEATARRRNRELMETKRKPGNPDGDGKPYGTTERHVMRVAEDGEAILAIEDTAPLSAPERSALLALRPAKFELRDEALQATAGME